MAHLALASAASAGGNRVPSVPDAVRPRIGLWLTVWWTKDDQYHHWVNCHVFPKSGPYTEGDPQVIQRQFAAFRDMGIDFLIMDDTNGCGNDGGRINDNIRAWFDFMDAQPASSRIPICVCGGGEMRAEGAAGQRRAADFYWSHWAQRPSYFKLDGKPLLLIDTDKNYGPGDFTDERFTVRWVYNGDNRDAMKARETWGWGCYEPLPALKECMSIWPGHRFASRITRSGTDPDEVPREGGECYVRMWLAVLKCRPQFVTIADWNNFEEETALEESYSWVDRWGYAVPDLYVRITRAYSRLRDGRLVVGEYYRDEAKPDVFLFDGAGLIYQGTLPKRACVIVLPAGMLERLGAKR